MAKYLADLVIVDGQGLKEELQRTYKFGSDKVKVVKPGIDLQFINYISATGQSFEGIFVGQLRYTKGIFDLIAIWKQLTGYLPSAKLLIVGQDLHDNQKRLELEISKANLSQNITFMGFVSRGVLYSLMKSAKVLLLPSYEEGFGMVLAEALACGITPVAYSLPAFKEHFADKVITVPAGKINLFANVVKNALIRNIPTRSKIVKSQVKKFDVNKSVRLEIETIKYAYQKSLS